MVSLMPIKCTSYEVSTSYEVHGRIYSIDVKGKVCAILGRSMEVIETG